MDKIRMSISGPSTAIEAPVDAQTHQHMYPGQQQTTFLGRRFSQAIVPAFARKASLAKAEKDRNPGHLRMGETDLTVGDDLGTSFFTGKLTIDEASDEEKDADTKFKVMDRRRSTWATAQKGKGKETDWQTKLGWDSAPPKGSKKVKRKDVEAMKRKHRHKRAMRELDNDLDAYNLYAQNGQAVLTRSANQSSTSLATQLTNAPGALDNESFLPAESMGPRAVLVGDGFDAIDVMADHIFRLGVSKKKWFKPPRMGAKRDEPATGVTIRVKTGLYRSFPVDYEALEPFEDAITRLNPEVSLIAHFPFEDDGLTGAGRDQDQIDDRFQHHSYLYVSRYTIGNIDKSSYR